MKRWRYRVNFFGKVILQRMYRKPIGNYGDWEYFWKDAKSTNLTEFFEDLNDYGKRNWNRSN